MSMKAKFFVLCAIAFACAGGLYAYGQSLVTPHSIAMHNADKALAAMNAQLEQVNAQLERETGRKQAPVEHVVVGEHPAAVAQRFNYAAAGSGVLGILLLIGGILCPPRPAS